MIPESHDGPEYADFDAMVVVSNGPQLSNVFCVRTATRRLNVSRAYAGFRCWGLQMARIMVAIECILPRIRHHAGRLHSVELS
jgi:hypothetical protein